MNQRTCDNCGRVVSDTNPVIAKLYLSPIVPGRTRSQHSHYTGHMDIGRCCADKVVKGMKWQKRKPQLKKQRVAAA